jgi:phosphonate transport system substrate-binding protein
MREERIFYLGRIPFVTATEVVRQSNPLLTQLAQRLGYDRVVMVLAPNYSGVLDLLLDRKVDVAWFGTEAFLDARRRGLPVDPLVVPSRHGRGWYAGEIIVRSDAKINTLADLRGKRFAFVDPQSSSGYAAPRRMLEAAGLRLPEDLKTRHPGELDFLSKHDNVVNGVLFDRFDAGAVYAGAVEDVFAKNPARRKEITVLAHTGKIPNEPIVVRSDLGAERRRRIRKAFLTLEIPVEENLFGGVEGFLPTSQEFFGEEVRSGEAKPAKKE